MHRGLRAVVAVLSTILLGACATGRTTVILLPDQDGHVGAVTVSSNAGEQRVDHAWDAVSVDALESPPGAARALGQQAVEARYLALMSAQPGRPLTFVLNFVLDSTQLTDASRARLRDVLQAVRERKPTEITVFGHADASGSERRNLALSAERARAVAELLRIDDPKVGPIDVQYFGDKVPLVPNDSPTAQAQNRRVEILVL